MTSIPAILRPGSNPLSMNWDSDNRLSSADIDNDSTADVSYKFDALGRRVARHSVSDNEETIFVQSGQQTVADYTAGTAATSPKYTYVYASYIDEPVMRGGTGGLRYFHRTQQYSITAMTNGGGSIVERYAYSAYGTPTITDATGVAQTVSSEGNRYLYTGREWDEELSLYHYRARMYDSVGGRFLGRDPIGFEGSPWNLFEYVLSSPMNYLDAPGLRAVKAFVSFAEMKRRAHAKLEMGMQLTIDDRKILGLPPKGLALNGTVVGIGGKGGIGKIQSPKRCGYLLVKCGSGVYSVPVTGESPIPYILNGDDGCATTPFGIVCSGGCKQIKNWKNNGKPLLNHEGCHFCAFVDKGCLGYIKTWGFSPDACVNNEVPTHPLW